jgi:hypothetical protein
MFMSSPSEEIGLSPAAVIHHHVEVNDDSAVAFVSSPLFPAIAGTSIHGSLRFSRIAFEFLFPGLCSV